ncbi:MAG: hypothetical protein JSU73_02875 [candidate division WOR-3 bacterium]|nr:MAG: hypothetical protein JSU73_02875 [candidate division WOR-3 bacterium]
MKVIDCERDSVVATVPMGRIVRDMCYVAEVGKVYVAMFKNREASGQVAIIDGATNRLLRRVDAGEVTHVVCYNPANNSVYCANWRDGTVTVIDGASDSVSATVLLGRNPYALASNARENRVYCACPEPLLPSGTLIVIDGVTGGIVDRLPVYGLPSAVCCNERTNKIYCASDYHDQHPPVAEAWLEIWDGQTGSLLRQMRVGREYPCSLYCCEWSNKVYCADRDAGTVTVIDGNTDAIVCVIPVGLGPMSFAGNPRFGRVYVNLAGESAVAVIRDTVGVGLNGSHRAPARCSPQASIARGVLQLESIAGSSQLAAELLDIIGRKVMDLLPGANDIRHVAPGVYFVRTAESGTRSAVRKVVIQR